MRDRNSNIKKEFEALKEENENLRKYIRPETLSLMKLKSIASIEASVKKTVYIKYLLFPIIILLILSFIAFSLFYYNYSFKFEPLVTDTALKDPDFIADSIPQNYNIYGNTIGNINNNRLLSAQDTWLYFSDGNRIFKTKTDLNKEPLKISDLTAKNINIIGNWLYYIDTDNNYICTIRVDGKDKKILLEEPVKQIMVYKSLIYFIDQEDQLKRILVDGSNHRKVSGDIPPVLSFYINDNIIYYVADADKRLVIFAHDLIRNFDYPISTTDSAKIVFQDGYIFFLENDYLYKIKPDGNVKSKQIVSTDITDIFNIINDKILYVTDTDILYCVDSDGTDKIMLTSPLFEAKDINYIYNAQDTFIIINTNDGIYYSDIDKVEFNTLLEVE